MNLYITQDRIGTPTGGGAVTYHEYLALSAFSKDETHPIDGARIPPRSTPFESDMVFASVISITKAKLAALYAGCFTETVKLLKLNGAKVSYTAAAHDINESRREFEELGVPYNFPHLTDPEQWDRYVGGYRQADLVICPSSVSRRCMESYGCKNVSVVAHGCDVPSAVAPMPKKFTVGYLGQAGPDKGLRYLFEAWKRLDMKDATLLIGGNNIETALPLWRRFGGGNVEFTGFVKNISDFYNRVSVYVQPSVTEGFGIEVLEAMAHARPVIVSNGAGSIDMVRKGAGRGVSPRDPVAIANYIENYRANPTVAHEEGVEARKIAEVWDWGHARELYQVLWKRLLA